MFAKRSRTLTRAIVCPICRKSGCPQVSREKSTIADLGNPFGVCRAQPPMFGEADWRHCMRCVRCMRCLRCSVACVACLACVVHVACVACVACRNLRPVLPEARGDTKRRRDSECVVEWLWGTFFSKNVSGMEAKGVADFWKTHACEKTTFFGRLEPTPFFTKHQNIYVL